MSVTTTLKYYDGTYTFVTQSSTTFLFRVDDGMGDYVDYNPNDYIPQLPPIRGNRKETVGGSAVIQQFVHNGLVKVDCDRELSFSMFLTKAEYEDINNASKKPGRFLYTDFLGNSWLVTFDNQEGLAIDYRIKANDKFLVRFKFWVYSQVS